ncbi:hypothetical protein CVV38_03335 [Candidatus Peregrinibacteria bacterium HGW-Peregrinibacteria-1]|jgi:hypothetical protein|nr:MAG: hypothetical protein CVV38_03335 [Candidatus Peregrinibacteria bacterium HGW-Peregrinibacteria-1]
MESIFSDVGIDVEVLQSNAKTSSIRLLENKAVIRLSSRVKSRDREVVLLKFKKWLIKKLHGSTSEGSSWSLADYRDGGVVVTHNKIYELVVKEGSINRVSSKLNENIIEFLVPVGKIFGTDDMKRRVKRIIMKDQQLYLEDVLNEINANYFQGSYVSCKFKDTRSRYGSCSNKGDITIAYKLLFAPKDIFRYVCVHELAHLFEFNHSAKFWTLVRGAMPEFKEAEMWLKKEGWKLG